MEKVMEIYDESNFQSKLCTSIGTNDIHLHMTQTVAVGFYFSEVKNLYCNAMEISESFCNKIIKESHCFTKDISHLLLLYSL